VNPVELPRTVLDAVRRAVEAGELTVPVPDRVVVERGHGQRRGEYSTGVALRLARAAGRPAHEVAAVVARRLAASVGIAGVETSGPGFLNITLDATAHADLVRAVRTQRLRYGHNDSLAGTRTPAPQAPAAQAPAAQAPAPQAPAPDTPRAAACRRLARACGAHPTVTHPVTAGVQATHPGTPHAPGTPDAPDFTVPRELGRDAYVWACVRTPAGGVSDLDPARHLPQRESNPLFRVRYGHARARALLRNAADLGFAPEEGGRYVQPAEDALLGAIADYPRVVEAAARDRAPDRVARALEGVAEAFFDFHDSCPVLPRGDEKPSAAHRARLALADATGTVLAGGLTLLGISAPEHL
jgi:arginyl-tRNA synthetase